MASLRLRQAIAACALPAAVVAGTAAPVHAQQAAIEEIVVTGSYIRRSTEDSASPLTIFDRASMEQIGAIEIADVVNRMTFNSGATNTTNAFSGGDNNTGQTNINIRNLGLGSTLVLLDGKRSVAASSDSGGNTFVPLGTLVPTIAIERLEVLKDGASALYGSDAIAGVVNVITRQNFEGFEVQVDYRTDQETRNQDDLTLSGIWGIGGDRGNLVVSAEYLDRKGLQIKDRFSDYGGSGVSTLGQPPTTLAGPIPGIPQARAIQAAHLVGGGVATGLGGAIAGDLDCEAAGALANNQSFYSPLTGQVGGLEGLGACIYDFSPHFNLVGEEERLLTHISGTYNLNDNHEFYGSFRFADQKFRRGNSLFPLVRFPTIGRGNPGLENDLARRQAALSLVPGSTILAGPVLDDDDNIIAPAITAGEIDLPSQVGGVQMFGRVLGGAPDSPFDQRPIDTDTREFTTEHRIQTGIRGDLEFIDGWTYDLSFLFGKRKNQARNTDTRQQQLELALAGRGGPLCNSLTGTPGSGNMGTGNCFFFNPFGSALVKPDGSIQDDPMLRNDVDMLEWMVGEIRSVSETTTKVVDFVITGDVMEMANGLPLGMALGFQWRQDKVFFDADADSNANNYSFIFGAADFTGQEDVYAGFLELAIPVTQDFDIGLALRYEKFDDLGDDTLDPKISGLWRATDDLTLRASWGTSFRVGSLLQRFGQSTQLLNIADVDFGDTSLAFRPIITQGNVDLSPEEATVWNIGLSYAPTDGPLANLRVDVDYFNYDYDDLITREGFEELLGRDIAARCPNGLNNVGNPNNPAACGRQTDADGNSLGVATINDGIPEVIRGNNLQLLRVQNTFVNAQELKVDGIDFNVSYTLFTNGMGSFTPAVQGSWMRTYDLTNPQGQTIDGIGSRNFGNSVGRTLPEWRVNTSLAWNMDRHS
ncbi:MAG: TonB-dependent receptor, partial [Gammaproteobacteria bacterium]|nr:TonB-dependent receptor [Gammaproteobacteria bacterium]